MYMYNINFVTEHRTLGNKTIHIFNLYQWVIHLLRTIKIFKTPDTMYND